MEDCSVDREQPFKNGLRQKTHNRIDEAGDDESSPESIQGKDTDVGGEIQDWLWSQINHLESEPGGSGV